MKELFLLYSKTYCLEIIKAEAKGITWAQIFATENFGGGVGRSLTLIFRYYQEHEKYMSALGSSPNHPSSKSHWIFNLQSRTHQSLNS